MASGTGRPDGGSERERAHTDTPPASSPEWGLRVPEPCRRRFALVVGTGSTLRGVGPPPQAARCSPLPVAVRAAATCQSARGDWMTRVREG